MKRFFSFLLMAITLLNSIVPWQAKAQSITGPWTWTDISSQIIRRINRPTWAVAYGNDYWFYTDGLSLENSGQVYRYDGFTQTSITGELLSAGLTRVDDIVSDGETILFLQDIVRFDNQLRIVAYKNGQYLNITSGVRNVLAGNEGVSQIVGRQGNWRIVTTEGRILGWDGSSANAFEIALPSFVTDVWNRYKSLTSYKQRMIYNPEDSYTLAPLKIQPMNDSEWMIQVVDEEALTYEAYNSTWEVPVTYFYRVMKNNTVDPTSIADFWSGDMIASNGNEVLVVQHGSTRPYYYIYTLSSSGKKGLHAEPIVNFHYVDIQLRASWNGKSWMVLSLDSPSRVAYRFDSNHPVNALSEARFAMKDYLFTLASDQHGRTLLGGAAADMGVSGYLLPLTAKLVMVNEDMTSSSP